MQRSSRGKLAFHCGPVKRNFRQFCINFGTASTSTWPWKPGSGTAWSKRWAWNLKRLWFEAVFVPSLGRWTPSAACWQEQRPAPAPMGEIENANTWHMWGKQERTHPLDWAPKANHELRNDEWSILFHSHPGSVNLSYFRCKDEGHLFSRCFEYPAHACHVTSVMLAELLPEVGAKAESNMAW